jgi:N-acetylneuraminic acid mutarotase
LRFIALAAAILPSFISAPVNAQAGEWGLMGGTTTPDAPGVYGTLGVPSALGIPGGRWGAATWTDAGGNLWLFGGRGADSNGQEADLNDLWKFTPSTPLQNSQWTWMGGDSTVVCEPGVLCTGHAGVYGTLGTPAPGNIPGSREGAMTWTDASGDLWLFGGFGLDSVPMPNVMNDLWKFTPANNQWTWMGGNNKGQLLGTGGLGQPGVYGTLGTPAPGNIPGGRSYASTWIDSAGNFWLFGGQGDDAHGQVAHLNDLWKFDPTTGLWAWMAGSDVIDFCGSNNCGQPGIYGTLGTPAAGNTPGGRSRAASWIDNSDDLWLFGGYGFDVKHNSGYGLNDLWKFDPKTGLWVWMSGSSEIPCASDPLNSYLTCTAQPGVYGTLGVPADTNEPPGEIPSAAWVDQQGNLWVFGGLRLDVTGQAWGTVNDLWAFNPSTRQWVWMGGDTAASNCAVILTVPFVVASCDGSPGVFGTQYQAAPGNYPGTRQSAAAWVDKNGGFWLFGGGSGFSLDVSLPWNDLWKYQPSIGTLPAAVPPIFSLKPGTYFSGGPLAISNGMAGSAIYFTTDGTTPTTSSTLYTAPLNLSSSKNLKAVATVPGYAPSSVASAAYTFLPVLAVPAFSPAPGAFSSAQTVSISDSSPNTTVYYTTDGSTPDLTSTRYTGPFAVTSSETINAIAKEDGYAVSNRLSVKGSWMSAVGTATYTINLPPPDFAVGGTAVTVARGAQTGNTSTITVTPAGGFTGKVTLTAVVTSSPAGAVHPPTLSFGATTPVTIAGTNPGNATLTISTTAATSAALHSPASQTRGPLAIGGATLAFLFLLFGIPTQRRKWQKLVGFAVLFVLLAGAFVACGGGGNGGSGGGGGGGGGGTSDPGTTPGDYTITVTAVSGALTHTAAVSLTVK